MSTDTLTHGYPPVRPRLILVTALIFALGLALVLVGARVLAATTVVAPAAGR